MIIGIRFVLWVNIVGVLFLILAYFASSRRHAAKMTHAHFNEQVELADIGGTKPIKKVVDKQESSSESHEEYTKEELRKEIYKKRGMSHGSLFD